MSINFANDVLLQNYVIQTLDTKITHDLQYITYNCKLNIYTIKYTLHYYYNNFKNNFISKKIDTANVDIEYICLDDIISYYGLIINDLQYINTKQILELIHGLEYNNKGILKNDNKMYDIITQYKHLEPINAIHPLNYNCVQHQVIIILKSIFNLSTQETNILIYLLNYNAEQRFNIVMQLMQNQKYCNLLVTLATKLINIQHEHLLQKYLIFNNKIIVQCVNNNFSNITKDFFLILVYSKQYLKSKHKSINSHFHTIVGLIISLFL